MTINEFTKILRSKGWTVSEACNRWGIRIATYHSRCRNRNLNQQLEDMCNGLPNKLNLDK